LYHVWGSVVADVACFMARDKFKVTTCNSDKKQQTAQVLYCVCSRRACRKLLFAPEICGDGRFAADVT
jgi:hypothetical protein